MKLFVAAALAASVGTAAFGANEKTQLQDIGTYWGKTAVQYFYDHQYVTGANGKFMPDEDITREGVAVIIDNLIGEDGNAPEATYTDIKGRWSAKAIASLVDKQIMQGYSDNTFKPAQKIQREEFAVIAYNYMSYKGLAPASGKIPRFADEEIISPWAKEAVGAMTAAGYMSGSQNRFNPRGYVTRGEAVNVLYRIIMDKGGAAEEPAAVSPVSDGKTTRAGERQEKAAGAAVKPADTSRNVQKAAEARQEYAETTASDPAATPEELSVETKVFKDIAEVYGSIKKFADDGIMYWQGNTLHIGVKTRANRNKLETVLMDDPDIPAEIIYLQTARRSYADYKRMMEQARQIYLATEATNAPVRTEVDYLNEKIVLIVQSVSDETRKNLNDELGSALRIIVQ